MIDDPRQEEGLSAAKQARPSAEQLKPAGWRSRVTIPTYPPFPADSNGCVYGHTAIAARPTVCLHLNLLQKKSVMYLITPILSRSFRYPAMSY